MITRKEVNWKMQCILKNEYLPINVVFSWKLFHTHIYIYIYVYVHAYGYILLGLWIKKHEFEIHIENLQWKGIFQSLLFFGLKQKNPIIYIPTESFNNLGCLIVSRNEMPPFPNIKSGIPLQCTVKSKAP